MLFFSVNVMGTPAGNEPISAQPNVKPYPTATGKFFSKVIGGEWFIISQGDVMEDGRSVN